MDLQARAERLAQLMEERMDIRGTDLAAKLSRAGRRLPKRIHRDGAVIVQALELEAHPRLSRQMNMVQVKRAADHLERFLLDVDPWARRKGKMLNWLAGIAFSLLLILGLTLAVLRWRGVL